MAITNKLLGLALMVVVLTLQHLLLVMAGGATSRGGGEEEELDRNPLLSFMSGITSDPQRVLSDWDSGLSVCNWTGIRCSLTYRRVIELNLSGASLSGMISPSISNLTFLTILDFSKNFFTGTIPTSLGRLSGLKELSLSSNQFKGFIPDEFVNLNQLVYLDLGSNLLDGEIPKSLFCNCSSLQYIDLSNNSLAGIIPVSDLCELKDLRFLLLWSNMFVGSFPRALSNSTRLEWIDIESNFLAGYLPAGIVDKMPSLQFLYLSNNNMSSHDGNTDLYPFFSSISSCRRLQEVQIAGNGIGGAIPDIIGNLSVSLLQLHLQQNKINGQIPANISNLLNLTSLNLSNNILNGSIPSDLSRLRNLERLYLSNNLLTGEIPSDLGQIQHLGLLDLSGNRISGTIPESVSELSQLRRLMLQKNKLSGPIPSGIGNCNNLEVLDLSYNNLTGSIPGAMAAGLSGLTLYINLSSNSLDGSLPLELSKMNMVISMDFSSNNFTGTVPAQIGSCVAVEYLNLSGNNLNGSLPNSIGKLDYLTTLDLSSNRLTGSIPESFRSSTSLKQLNLSFNLLTGSVPNEGFFSSLTSDSFMGNQGLCGSVVGMTPCSIKTRRNHRNRIKILLLLPIILLPLIPVPLFLFYYLFGRHSFQISTGSSQLLSLFQTQDYPRISYRQLVLATDGFDESNLVGTGSFGKVYKGELRDQTRIAVKVLDPRAELVASFSRECDVLKRTRHRNLIRIITTCSRPDFKALVLPLMSNGSLETHLYQINSTSSDDRRLSLVQLLGIASDVAEGMSYLHHYAPVRVVHCDLKPSNVLLDDGMTAVVSDFGLARLTEGGGNETVEVSTLCNSKAGLLVGSIGYIAPEYGTGGNPSTQGDVYSFGILILEMITGRRPTNVLFHEGLTLQEWVRTNYPNDLHLILQQSILMINPNNIENPTTSSTHHHITINSDKLWREVLMELIEVGLACSQMSPSMRPTMVEVAQEIGQLKKDLNRVNVGVVEQTDR